MTEERQPAMTPNAEETVTPDFELEPMEEEVMRCTYCNGTGLAPEGWDCEECDGLGYWEE